ncbi:MAG: hypothetical protein O9340_07670 [Cyclobacteriaceae bacterium]|jgi:hypothetical protein|nr:hypothetical protein [Cyclobacteriaceae bacterium]
MKKYLLMIAFLMTVALTLSSCTEEEVKPADKNSDYATGSAKMF